LSLQFEKKAEEERPSQDSTVFRMNKNELAFRHACEAYDPCAEHLRVPLKISTISQERVHGEGTKAVVVVSTVVEHGKKTIIVSARGTSSIENIEIDTDLSQVP
jgi:hypothetical protein